MKPRHQRPNHAFPELHGKALPLAILVATGSALSGSALASPAISAATGVSNCFACHDAGATVDKSTVKAGALSAFQSCGNTGVKNFANGVSPACPPAATPKPTAAPTAKPTAAPTAKPTAAPTTAPIPNPTTAPVPTPQGTAKPQPTHQGTAVPAPTPAATPNPSATPAPSTEPSPAAPSAPPAVNHIPRIHATPGSSASLIAGSAVTIKVEASDSDGDPINLSAWLDNKKVSAKSEDGSASFSIKNGVGTFSWTPSKRSSGLHSLLLKASDGKTSSEHELTLNVKRAAWLNEHPEIAAIPGTFVALPGSELKIPLSATDADGDRISFSIDELPSGAKLSATGFDPATRQWQAELVYTPEALDAGKRFPLQITASDDFNANHKQTSKQTEIVVLDANGAPADAKIGAIAIIKAFARNHDHTTLISGKVSLADTSGSYAGYSVNLTDAVSQTKLGSATLNTKGEWHILATGDTFCAVRAEVGGHVDERAVNNAAASCKE